MLTSVEQIVTKQIVTAAHRDL